MAFSIQLLLRNLEEDYENSNKLSLRFFFDPRNFKQWQIQKASELQADEEMKLQEEYEKVKNKFQSDINLVKQKLAEEKQKMKEEGDRKNEQTQQQV